MEGGGKKTGRAEFSKMLYKFAKKTIIEGGLVQAGPLSERRQREETFWCVGAVNNSGLPRPGVAGDEAGAC